MNSVQISEKTIGESLKIILVKKQSNISRLADMMGVSNTTLYSKFKRNNFTVNDLNAICKALDINYSVVFTLEEEE